MYTQYKLHAASPTGRAGGSDGTKDEQRAARREAPSGVLSVRAVPARSGEGRAQSRTAPSAEGATCSSGESHCRGPTLTRVFILRTAPTPGDSRLGVAVTKGRFPVAGKRVPAHAHAQPLLKAPLVPIAFWTCWIHSHVNCGGYT